MNELITRKDANRAAHWYFLATASALAMTGYISSTTLASAENDDRPVVWFELGPQFEQMAGKSETFVPPENAMGTAAGFPSLTSIEHTLGKSFGGEGSLSLQSPGSDWVFTAAVRYGRVHSKRHAHKQMIAYGEPIGPTPGGGPKKNVAGGILTITPTKSVYADQKVDNTESHTIADFQVGRDVGLGLFGNRTESVVSVGARYVRLKTTSEAQAHLAPDFTHYTQVVNAAQHKYNDRRVFHNSVSDFQRISDFRALGPSLTLSNATHLMGTPHDGELAVDWGANVAVLFGRQSAETSHHSHAYLHQANVISILVSGSGADTRSRHVMVPDVGGFAALSYRFSNAKMTAGYRADFFFGAMDGGIDTRSTETVGFHGPYATVSIGFP